MMNVISAPKLLLYIFITFSGCLVGSFASVTRDVTEDRSLYKLCPYTDYCTRNATNKLEDHTKQPCCGYCSCADDCWKRGNCCMDKGKLTAKQPLESCEAVSLKRSGHQITNTANTEWQYYVINSCPTKDDALAEKCRGELQSSLEDFIWVTDRRTNKIYNNKHCAVCHGVVDYTPWQIATHCTEALNGQNSPNEVVNRIIDECRLTAVPPSMEDHTDNVCLIPEITQCNVTGQWEVYDQALETACNSFSQIYLEEKLFGTPVYSNVYCFLCNSQYPLVWDICTSTAGTKRNSPNGFMGILDFTEINRVKAIGANDELRQDPVCTVDEIKDPFQYQCLKLSCPMLQTPVYGKCVKLTSSTRFLGVSALLLVYPVWSKTNLAFEESSYPFENLAKKLSIRVQRDLGLLKGKCKPCEELIRVTYDDNKADVDGNPIPEMFSIYLTFYTTDGCQEDVIVERMYQLLGKEIKLQFGREYMTLIVSAASDQEYDYYLYKADDVLVVTFLICPTQQYTDFQQLSSCPSVSLNFTDYVNLMKSTEEMSRKRVINSLFNLTQMGGKVATNTENFTAQVCFESYLSVLPKKNQGVCFDPINILLLVTAVISNMFGA